MIKNSSAILIVLIAGLLWSFGPLVVRYIDDAQLIPWQYLFFRGSVIFLVLNIYLFLAEGPKFTKNYNKIGLSGLIGGVSLGIANISFILSINYYCCCNYDDASNSTVCSCNFSLHFFERKNFNDNLYSNSSSSWRYNIYVFR